jgi:putative methionine-R-sulfoxide reductase with GAF domain
MFKKYLGQIFAEMGLVTRSQLDEALQRQKQIMKEKMSPERLQRNKLVTEERLSKDSDMAPLLGQILIEMGLVVKKQLKQALKEQEKSSEAYGSLEKNTLRSLIEIGALVNSTRNLADVLHLIMKHANRMTNSIASTLMLLDEKTGELVFSVPSGPEADKLIDIRIPPGKGIAGWVLEQEQSALVPNVKEDSRFYQNIDENTGFETKSILCVPLKVKTKLIGVLEVINKIDGSCFTEEDELLLNMFSYQAAGAIENARLYNELKEQLEESRQAVTDRIKAEQEKGALITDLRKALQEVKRLSGLLPVCSFCKKIKDDKGYWNQIEDYIRDHSEAEFSHSICQECAKKHFPDMDLYGDDQSQQ